MAKLWGGRFEEGTDKDVEAFTTSIDIDSRLWSVDIRGSIAHAKMLGNVGVLPQEEASKIASALENVHGEIEAALKRGENPFRPSAEDVHSEIEMRLTEKLGPLAGKLPPIGPLSNKLDSAARFIAPPIGKEWVRPRDELARIDIPASRWR